MKRIRRNGDERNRFSIVILILTIVGIITAITIHYQGNWTYSLNKIRKEVKDSVQVAKVYSITSGVGGNGASTQTEVDRRRWIMKHATESELLELIKYPNGTVKAIAYEGLLRDKNFTDKTDLTLKAINDTTHLVDYQSGCIGWEMEIGEYLVQEVLKIDDRILQPPAQSDFGLTESDKEKILTEFYKRQKAN